MVTEGDPADLVCTHRHFMLCVHTYILGYITSFTLFPILSLFFSPLFWGFHIMCCHSNGRWGNCPPTPPTHHSINTSTHQHIHTPISSYLAFKKKSINILHLVFQETFPFVPFLFSFFYFFLKLFNFSFTATIIRHSLSQQSE